MKVTDMGINWRLVEPRKFFAGAEKEATGSQFQVDNCESREGPDVVGEW